MICHATVEELPAIADATKPLYYESGHPFEPNKEIWVKSWKNLINSGAGVIFIGKTDKGEIEGALAGVFFPSLNTGLLQASELVWYVIPEHRGHALGWTLYKLFENEARARHCATITMSHLAENDSVEILSKFYKAQGFKKLETVFVKEIL